MTPVLSLVEGLARGLVVRLYGLLFELLIVVVPQADELDAMLNMLGGDGDEWFD